MQMFQNPNGTQTNIPLPQTMQNPQGGMVPNSMKKRTEQATIGVRG